MFTARGHAGSRRRHRPPLRSRLRRAGDRRPRASVCRGALLSLLGLVATLVAAAVPAAAATPQVDEAVFVSRINQLRVGLGLSPLAIDPELTSVGRSWAAGMALSGRISHNPDYPYVLGLDWEIGAENVGAGSGVDVLFAAFVNSPGHYANLVNPDLTRVGVGVVHGADGRIYTAHQFARVSGDRPAPPAPGVAPAPGVTAPAGFAPVSPAARVLDTRSGGRPLAGTIYTIDLSAVPGVTASTTAVALNLTADSPGAPGYVSVWAADRSQPSTSVLNYAPGPVRAARSGWVLIPLSPDRRISLFTSASAHLIADVTAVTNLDETAGYATLGDTPVRAYDSRSTGALSPGETRTVALAPFGVPAGATLVALNLTAISAAIGYTSAAATPEAAAVTSTVNTAPGAPRANFALVPVGPGGTITLYASAGADLIVDIAGYVAPGATGRFVAVLPTRVVDTRATRTVLTPVDRRMVPLPFAGLPAAPGSVVGTLTVVDPVGDGWAAASGAEPGSVSNVNFAAGPGATAAGVMTPIPSGDATWLVASTVADVLFDVTGVIVDVG